MSVAELGSRRFPLRGQELSLDWGAPVYALAGIYALAAYAAIAATGADQAFAFGSYLIIWPAAFFGIFPAVYGLLLLLRIVHRLPGQRARRLAFRRALAPAHVGQFATGLALLLAMMVFQGAFTSIKTALPIWQGDFLYDVAQANIDRALHFGADPWRYLYALGENRWLLAFLEWNYNQGWFLFCYATLFVVAVTARASAIRTRYLVAYMLTWILIGNVLAGIFLSAGPAFYGLVTGDDVRFGEQLAFLAGSSGLHSAAQVQNYLWHFHASGQSGLGSGISAFPSMHVGLVTLNALFIAERSRRWGYAAFAYVGLILASSVYLAWHYAIDGYVAIAVTTAVYLATRKAFSLRGA